jgi:hypothetical protein
MIRRRHAINPPLNIYKKLALSFIVLTVILLGVIFYFTFSYAYITITPKPQDIATDFNFVIVEDANAVNAQEGIFLGQVVNQTIDGEKSFDATGSQPSKGELVGLVKIFNTQSKPQTLIATTRLLTAENVLYRIKDKVVIPAKGSIETQVYPDSANEPLVNSGTKFTIPGLSKSMQQVVYAEAVNDFKAAGQMVKAVTQDDLNNGLAALSDELAQKLFTDAQSGQVKILSKEVLDKKFSNKAGDITDTFTVSLKLKVVGVIFDDKPVKDFATKALESMVPQDKQVVGTNVDSLLYEVEKYDLNNKSAQIKSNIKGQVILGDNSPILDKENLIKLNSNEIKAYLENFDDIASVDITFFPTWIKKMPSFTDHIIIRINK